MRERHQISRVLSGSMIARRINEKNRHNEVYDVMACIRRKLEWNLDKTFYRELCSIIRDEMLTKKGI